MAKIKNLDGGKGGGGEFELKNFIYTYSLFKGNHSIERKIIEYGIILLHKYKVKQTEVVSRLLLFTFFLSNYKNVWSYRIFTFSKHIFTLLSRLRYQKFKNYSSNHILKVYKAPNQTVA